MRPFALVSLQAEAALAAVQNSTRVDGAALREAKQSAKKAQAEASQLQQEVKQAKTAQAEAAKGRKSLARAEEKIAAVSADPIVTRLQAVFR